MRIVFNVFKLFPKFFDTSLIEMGTMFSPFESRQAYDCFNPLKTVEIMPCDFCMTKGHADPT